jgi:hypothetical protein
MMYYMEHNLMQKNISQNRRNGSSSRKKMRLEMRMHRECNGGTLMIPNPNNNIQIINNMEFNNR